MSFKAVWKVEYPPDFCRYFTIYVVQSVLVFDFLSHSCFLSCSQMQEKSCSFCRIKVLLVSILLNIYFIKFYYKDVQCIWSTNLKCMYCNNFFLSQSNTIFSIFLYMYIYISVFTSHSHITVIIRLVGVVFPIYQTLFTSLFLFLTWTHTQTHTC